jgi:DNA uptake protein ComE-like DNA-binding protein
MFYLTPQERKFICLIMTVFILGAAVQLLLRRDIAPVRWAKSVRQFKININTARTDQLQMLPGIGAALASRIVEYRRENGVFKTL